MELDLPLNPNDIPGTTPERFMLHPRTRRSIHAGEDCGRNPEEVSGWLDRVADASNPRRDSAVASETAGCGGVLSPALAKPSEVVERALNDAERLITSSGAVSGIDRLHTALHGYLKKACSEAGITPPDKDPELTRLFRQLRENHPKFKARGARADDIATMHNSLASIVAVLNPIRNRASVAHPNEILLDAAEAHLVVNSVRTLLHYLEAKLT
jgi:hypothetical protein